MIEFLLAILIAALGQAAPELSNFEPAVIISKISNHISVVPTPGPSVPTSSEETPTPTPNPFSDLVSTEVSQVTPDTNKVQALNTQSGKVINSVAAVAVEKAPPLIPYTPILSSPTPSPTSTPTPTPVIEPDPIPDPRPTCPGMPVNRDPGKLESPICVDSEI